MKAALIALAALGSVAAINLDGIPKCAVPCLEEAIPKVGCSLDDTACQCSTATQEKLVSVVAPCLLKNCDSQELNQAQEAAGAACAAYSASAVATTVATPTGKATSATKAATSAKAATTTPAAATTPSGNSTATKTEGESETETGGSSDEGSGTATASSSQATTTDNAASIAGPAAGALLAVLAAALAL